MCLLPRRGITLLELLVVMLIILMVTAAAIPVIAPAMQNRQMREATRLVTSFMGAAKARAVQTGRPVGVVIERFNGQPFALQMAQVEVPPPYSGDLVNAQLTVTPLAPGSVSTNAQINFNTLFPGKTAEWFQAVEPTTSTGMLNTKLLRVGDQIQLNGQGAHYVILGPDPNYNGAIGDITATTPLEFAYVYTPPLTQVFPWKNTAPLPTPQAATYQVTRQPVRTSSPPLQLPEGIVFDLTLSGVGSGGSFMSPFSFDGLKVDSTLTPPLPPPIVSFDPMIIFSPSGRVEWVTDNSGQLGRATEMIYLLLGRRELMFDGTQRGNSNPAELKKDVVAQNMSPIVANPTTDPVLPPPENFWIVIGPSSGQVNTAQLTPNKQNHTLAAPGPPNPAPPLTAIITNSLPAARTYAKESQSLGGR